MREQTKSAGHMSQVVRCGCSSSCLSIENDVQVVGCVGVAHRPERVNGDRG